MPRVARGGRPPPGRQAHRRCNRVGLDSSLPGNRFGIVSYGNRLPAAIVEAGEMHETRTLGLALAVAFGVAACGSATTDASDAGETASCFVLSMTPTPTSGGSFEASVQRRPGCQDQGELLGGLYLKLQEGDRTVAYLQTPNKVLPGDNMEWLAAGRLVDRPAPFKLPELNEGSYTLCSTFSTASDKNQKACVTFQIV